MDIRRIRAFRTVVEAGGLTKAAGLLHITPGALSKSMRQLEQETGRTLFDRDGRALRLTGHGTLLYRTSAALIEEHARVLRGLDTSSVGDARTLRLATNEVFSTHCLGALLEPELGDIPCQVLELQSGALERAVADREADIGITYVPAPRRGLTFRTVGAIDFHVYARSDAFRGKPFDALPFAVPVTRIDAAISDVLGIDCWPYERVPRLVRYRLTSLESALELCRRGRCALFAPAFLIGLHNAAMPRARHLARRAGPPELRPVCRRVHLVHRDTDRGDALIEATAKALDAALKRGAELEQTG